MSRRTGTPRSAVVVSSFNGGSHFWPKDEVVVATFNSYRCYEIRRISDQIFTDLVPVDLLSFNPRNFPREQNKKS